MPKQTPPPGETKADKFKRVAEGRVTTALGALKNLENLSNATTYEYSDDQVDRIVTALKAQIEVIEKCFAEGGKKQVENGFTL